MAMILVSRELPKARLDESTGELTLPMPSGDEVYSMTELPLDTASLVVVQKKGILQGVGLKDLLTNLNRASDLLFLAYMCTWGTGTLQGRIAGRQSDLLKLSSECVSTIFLLKKTCEKVLQDLLEAFGCLLEAEEVEALEILSNCAEYAKEMAIKCRELKEGFGSLREETAKDKISAVLKLGDQTEKVQELEKELANMKAKKASEEAKVEDSNKAILKTEAEIVKEEAKEDKMADRELILQVFGALASAAGSVAGAVVQVKTMGLLGGPRPDTTPKDTSAKAEEALASKESTVKAKKEELDEAKEEEKNAAIEKVTLTKRAFDAGVEKKTEEAAVVEAKSPEEKKAAKAALAAAVAKLEDLEDKQRKVEERVSKAERKKQAAIEAYTGAAKGLENLQTSFNKMADSAGNRVQQAATHRLALVEARIKKEEERRVSLGELASLTVLLESNLSVVKVDKSTQDALDIAVWAIGNIEVSLNNAAFFWENMQTSCEELAKPDTKKKIESLVRSNKSDEERKKFYKGRRFAHVAITYVCKWTALVSICDEYSEASVNAKKAVEGIIRKSPLRADIPDLILPLKNRLKEEMETEAAESDAARKDLEAQKKELEGGTA